MSSPTREGCHSVRPIWQAAVDSFYRKLDDGGMKRTSMLDEFIWKIKSPDALIDETREFIMEDSHGSHVWTIALPKLELVLSDLNNFATIIAELAGMDNRVSSLLWGSMKLLFKYAHPVFLDLVCLLEELRVVLPKSRISEKECLFTESFEKTLLNMYTEIIVFYGYAILFFRNNPIAATDTSLWFALRARFEDSLTFLRTYSMEVGKIIDVTQLSRETHRAKRVDVINNFRISEAGKNDMQRHVVPYGLNLKFYGRSTEIDQLKNCLDPRNDSDKLKVVSIYGLGGIGKTQLALQYVNTSRDIFDAIAWFQASTYATFIQSLLAFTSRLGLPIMEGNDYDDYRLVQKVKYWLNESGKTFLLIFDDMEDGHILNQIWPTSSKGSIIITSRSLAVAAERTKRVMQLKSFEKNVAVNILYELAGIQPADHKDALAAEEICQDIGGHPLAIIHMSSFLQNRGYSYEEFLAFYHKYAQKVFVKDQPRVDYDRSLSTVWNSSLQMLSSNARNLLNLLSFFDPDSISESLLVETKAEIVESQLSFLADEFDFGDAVSELISKASFVDRLVISKSLSLHRLVKFAILMRIPEDKRGLYLNSAIQLLFHAVPDSNSWNQQGSHQSDSRRFDETYNAVVPHLSSLIIIQKQYNLQVKNTELFAQLLLRVGTYLRDTEQPATANSFIEYASGFKIDRESPSSAELREDYRRN